MKKQNTGKKDGTRDSTPLVNVPPSHHVSGNKQVDEQAEQAPVVKREMPANAIPYQFKPGQTGNPNGRPRDIVKEIGKRIASAKASKALKPKERQLAEDLGFDPEDITLLEQIMLSLATSKHPLKIGLFLERTFGKVPNININAEVNAQLVTKFRAKFTDAELEDIADGANPMDILFDKLPDVDDAPRINVDNIIDMDVE